MRFFTRRSRGSGTSDVPPRALHADMKEAEDTLAEFKRRQVLFVKKPPTRLKMDK